MVDVCNRVNTTINADETASVSLVEWHRWRGYSVHNPPSPDWHWYNRRGYGGTDASLFSAGEAGLAFDPSPRCLRCGSAALLVRISYGSIHCGEYVCAKCLDAMLAREIVKIG